MSASLSPAAVTVPRRSGDTSSNQSSNSLASTHSIVSRFRHGRESLEEGFRNLRDQLSRDTSQSLSQDDVAKFRKHEGRLVDILANSTSSGAVRNGISIEPKRKGNKKVVVIGCENYSILLKVFLKLNGSEARTLVKKFMEFDDMTLNLDFMGHDAKRSLSSTLGYMEADFTTFSSLGAKLRISGVGKAESVMTVGGVILVDGRPYGLTTGCVIARHFVKFSSTSQSEDHVGGMEMDNTNVESDVSQAEETALTRVTTIPEFRMDEVKDDTDSPYTPRCLLPGRIVAYKYADMGLVQEGKHIKEQSVEAGTSEQSSTNLPGKSQTLLSREATDWALVELLGDDIPPNGMLNRAKESSQEWLWSTREEDEEMLVRSTVSESGLATRMRAEGRVACLTYTSAPLPIPGFIAAVKSTVILDGATFSVLRVDMSSPLEHGDSGSWVMVGNAVCGIIIAGTGRSANPKIVPTQESKAHVFGAYMIPIADVLDSISQALSAKVTLPTLVDYRLRFLQTQRRAARFTLAQMPPRDLDMELLLGQQQQQRRGLNSTEKLEVHGNSTNTPLPSFLLSKPGWFSQFVLKDLVGLHYETIYRLLPLGEICPLSAAFRPGFRQWAKDYRKARLESRKSFVCASIIERCLQTEAGENLLGLLIILWRTVREQLQGQGIIANPRSRRIAWLAQLLSALFGSMQIPKTAVPSTEQLNVFVYYVIYAFKDKDLKHLYLILDANYRVGKAKPSSDFLSPSLPSRQNAAQRAWTAFLAWIWQQEEADLLDVNRALSEGLNVQVLWDDTVSSMSHKLVTLHNIYRGDRSQVLVCSGLAADWVGFYAAVVLGLRVQFRRRNFDKTLPVRSPYRVPSHGEWPQVDVVIYTCPENETAEDVCEVIDRKNVGFPYDLDFGRSTERRESAATVESQPMRAEVKSRKFLGRKLRRHVGGMEVGVNLSAT